MLKRNAAIFVCKVSSSNLIKTKMANSTLDASWSSLKTILEYKSHQAGSGGRFHVKTEAIVLPLLALRNIRVVVFQTDYGSSSQSSGDAFRTGSKILWRANRTGMKMVSR
jgi:hypothetical protein